MSGGKAKVRADELLVRKGLAPSRSQARALIMAGEVRCGERLVQKPAELLDPESELEVERGPRFVSRGGEKLEAALDQFSIATEGRVAADIGASTGGFTDCLLQHGVARVYAIDVGYGQLHYRLRRDERVVVMERVNARYLESLPEPIDIVTIDVSFISLRHILPTAKRLLAEGGDVIALVKPQFEAGKDAVNRRGVVRDEATRERVVREIIEFGASIGLGFRGLIRSPLPGPAGNVEFFVWFRKGDPGIPADKSLRSVFGG